jgi:hypothetical protein
MGSLRHPLISHSQSQQLPSADRARFTAEAERGWPELMAIRTGARRYYHKLPARSCGTVAARTRKASWGAQPRSSAQAGVLVQH